MQTTQAKGKARMEIEGGTDHGDRDPLGFSARGSTVWSGVKATVPAPIPPPPPKARGGGSGAEARRRDAADRHGVQEARGVTPLPPPSRGHGCAGRPV